MHYLVRITTMWKGRNIKQTIQAVDAADAQRIARRLKEPALLDDSHKQRRDCVVCVSIPTRIGTLVIPVEQIEQVLRDVEAAHKELFTAKADSDLEIRKMPLQRKPVLSD